jgi:NEDD4-binding protein 2
MFVILMQGLPGSGKSTTVEGLRQALEQSDYKVVVVSADDYFVDASGVYNFDPSKIVDAHAQCQLKFQVALDSDEVECIIVDNTNTQCWEAKPYVEMASRVDCAVIVVEVHTDLDDEALAARNTHGVPVGAIAAMRARMEPLCRDDAPSIVMGGTVVSRPIATSRILASKAPWES